MPSHPAVGFSRWLRLVVVCGLSGLAGCSGGAVLLALLIDGGGSSAPPPPTIVSLSAGQGAPSGGHTIIVEARNLSDATSADFDGRAATVRRIDADHLEVTAPSARLRRTPFDLDNLVIPEDFAFRYHTASLSLNDRGGSTSRPYVYMQPLLRDLFDIEFVGATARRVETFGHRFESRFVYVEGDYFAFADDTETRVTLHRGSQEIAAFERIEAPPSGFNADPGRFWWAADGGCEVEPCPEDPHRGSTIRLHLPTEASVGAFLPPGPDYRIRVLNENGIDEIDVGYAPPFPPEDLQCEACVVAGDSPAVRLSWNDASGTNASLFGTGSDFSRFYVERFDDEQDDWIEVGVVPVGAPLPCGAPCAGAAAGAFCFLDQPVDFGVYRYRVYGELDGGFLDGQAQPPLRSPARTCDVAVLPEGEFHLIWDETEDEEAAPVVLKQGASGAPVAAKPSASATALADSLRSQGRAVFRLRRSGGAAARRVGTTDATDRAVFDQVFDTESRRVSVVWIVLGDAASFGVIDPAFLEGLRDYLRDNAAGLYIEGRRLSGAIDPGASPILHEILEGRLGIDPVESIRVFREEGGVETTLAGVPGSSARSTVTFDAGVETASEPIVGYPVALLPGDDEESPLGVVLTARLASALDGLEQDVALGVQSNGTVVSFFPVDGFAGADRATVVTELLARLDPLEGGIEETRTFALTPSEAPWNVPTIVTIEIVGEGATFPFDQVSEVWFDGDAGVFVDQVPSPTSLSVEAPAGHIPGRARVDLVLPDEIVPLGEAFDYTIDGTINPLRIDDLQPSFASPGEEFTVRGEFPPRPDARIFIGGLPAELREHRTFFDDVVGRIATEFTCVVPEGLGDTCAEVWVESISTGATSRGGAEPPCLSTGAGAEIERPVLARAVPDEGPAAGGTVVTLGGARLDGVTRVEFCGVAAEILTPAATDGDDLVVRTPPGCDECDIIAFGDGGDTSSDEIGFAYRRPAILEIFPDAGSRAGGTTVRVSGSGFTSSTELGFCGATVEAELVSETEMAFVTPAAEDAAVDEAGYCAIAVRDRVAGCDAFTVDRAFRYSAVAIFYGDFSFDLGDPGDRGGTRLRSLLEEFGFASLEVADAPLTPALLDEASLLFFSDVGHPLAAAERRAVRDWVLRGGGLVLLGQHGIVDTGGVAARQAAGSDPTNRNLLVRELGLAFEFSRDIVLDCEDHLAYDGCDPERLVCENGPTEPRGDPDNGEEYPHVYRPLQVQRGFESIVVDVNRILFNWGQTLEFIGDGPRGYATILERTSSSWGETQPVLESPEGTCVDPFFTAERLCGDESSDRDVAVAAIVGDGTVVAIGDQEFVWNAFLADFCIHDHGYQHLTFVRNVIEWLTRID